MCVVWLSLLCASIIVCDAFAQQGQQSYAPQTYAPQAWTPQSHAPQTHSPPAWTPQTGDVTGSLRRRSVRCSIGGGEYCVFSSSREFRPGSPCSCNGRRGTTN